MALVSTNNSSFLSITIGRAPSGYARDLHSGVVSLDCNGVEAFLYCQLEGAVGDETVTLARQQSTDIFFLVR